MSARPELDVLAHELRAPVAALNALATAAATGSGAVDRERLVALGLAAARDVARVLGDPDVRALAPEPVAVAPLVEAVALLDPARVRLDVAPGLVVVADPSRLRQALRNLVANGLRHGAVVTITARAVGAAVVVDVADDGPGVAPGRDVFARGESGVGSSGLGLWLARAIATAHGGGLELVEGPGGACFRLSVPSSPGGA